MNYKQIESPEYGTPNPKVYRALISQTGSNMPDVIVLENSLGGNPVITTVGTGQYVVTLTGAFPANKTFCLWQGDYFNGNTFWPLIGRVDDNSIEFYSYEPDNLAPVTQIRLVNLGVQSGALQILVYS